MKKFLFVSTAVILCCCMACSNKGGGISDKAQKNLDASHIVGNAFETGKTDSIDYAVASDFVDHSGMGDKNRDSLKAEITAFHAATKDSKTETMQEFANDDYVMSWVRFTGTSDGSIGMPKGPYDMHAIEVVKFKDGKAIEHWGYMEAREMMKMMAPPTMDNKMDSTK